MPRNATLVDDPQITIRFKYGIHIIFMFAMLDWTFSRLTDELLSVLRDRYPKGLTASIGEPEATTLPTSGSDFKLVYALPKTASDLSRGWNVIKAGPNDTLGAKGLTEMCSVAFAFLDPDANETDAEFPVELPILDDQEAL
ncbi:hypothetical protein N657DRAFT_653111 [Parathielavia appendiculata]|uniref:Uncharacterized protein n=1 Tax=Parathielavia appendiculata TaxID=2587402 RepID=A0AAN6UBR6_9PEZI|nr:hypothetical protein N657DRAFT_653111 [Parathielavia appendiculata]